MLIINWKHFLIKTLEDEGIKHELNLPILCSFKFWDIKMDLFLIAL